MRQEDTDSGAVDQIAIADRTTLVVTAEKDGKTSVQISTCTDTVKVLKDQVLEVRNIGGRLRIAKKVRRYDEKDPYVAPYDPYGDGEILEGA
jgi:NMD protein affecting ribosome stability and mRNA decay